ncbi:YicC/YloC family endoribonuclease [Mesonia aquimarina]|uniref:YicC/YloC family endoribonuclease n=1 Tax=Mesonia aquimarina TaxID=1504967 RepID=UPI000EF5AB58|nr:YicC/YloC family endoribonuclease [Mesonia aquimarina]
MIQSMTGFGKQVIELSQKKISIEIKSLNSKNLDLNARMPSQYREKELQLRNLISKNMGRGKVDFSLYVEITGEETTASVNASVVKKYINQLRDLKLAGIGSNQDADLLEMAMRLPDALKTQREEIDEDEFIAIENGVKQALVEINQYRSDEGKALEKDFKLRIENLQNLLAQVIEIDPERIEGVKERLQKAVGELKENVDENRFEQELIYYLEKYDITEEKIRLKNHLSYFEESLNSEDSNGKKLGFIGQEIGREINTIGSKSNYAPMQKLVVQMKDELEKIKEQLLNVL